MSDLDAVYLELAGRAQAGEGPALDDESAALWEQERSLRAAVLRAVVLMRLDRAADAHYVIQHPGGASHTRVDQRRHGKPGKRTRSLYIVGRILWGSWLFVHGGMLNEKP